MSKTFKQILDGLGDRDPDLREMACRDLEKGILVTKDLKLTANEESQLSTKFLEMMIKDQTLKVIASHTLVEMLNKSSNPSNVGTAVTTSVQYLLSEKHAEDEKTIREVSTYVVKGIILASAKKPPFQPSLIHGPILDFFKSKPNPSVVEYALDVIETLLVEWGSKLSEESGDEVYNAIQRVSLPYLKSQVYNIQSKAIGCVGNLGSYLSYGSFETLVRDLIKNLEASAARADCIGACTTLTSISMICRLTPTRFVKYLDQTVPLISVFVQAAEFTDEGEQVKVCEAALILFETIVTHLSSSSISAHYDTIQEQALQFISYDPTVIEGEVEEEAATVEFDYDADEGAADETETWRVRKECIRCIAAIADKTSKLGEVFDAVVEELIKRFTDSQLNVKIEVFRSFVRLLELVKASVDESLKQRFLEWVPTMVVALSKELKTRGDKSKIEAFALIQELTTVQQGLFDEHLPKLVPGFVAALKDSSENLRAAASTALRPVVQTTLKPVASFASFSGQLVPPLITAIKTANFKVTSAALRAASALSAVVVAPETLKQLASTVFAVLSQDGAPLEVKDAVMMCSGHLLADHAAQLTAKEIESTFKILGDRLGHATTSVAAAKAIQLIVSSPRKPSLPPPLCKAALGQLIDSLKLNNRSVRQASLEAMTAIVSSLNLALDSFEPLENHIDAEELLIGGLVLKLVGCSVKVKPSLVSDVLKFVLPKSIAMLKKSNVQGGGAVQSLSGAMRAVVLAKPETADELLKNFLTVESNIATAQVVGAIVAVHPKRDETLKRFMYESKSGSPFALAVLGELGSHVDISESGALDVVVGSLGTSLSSSAGTSSDKSVRYNAARALGSMAVTNPKKIISVFESQISKTPLYIVAAIRQSIEKLPHDVLEGSTESLTNILLRSCEKSDEVLRDAISDCLAKLIQSNLQTLKIIESSLKSEQKNVRACVTKALSNAINQQQQQQPLQQSKVNLACVNLTPFLNGMGDSEVEVRTAALGLLHTAIVKNYSTVKPLLVQYEKFLSVESARRNELVTKVTVGNNTLITDFGLPSRRTTFQIWDALISQQWVDSLNTSVVISSLASGCKADEEIEIQTLSHRIVIKLASLQPWAVLRGISSFDFTSIFLKVLPNTAIDVDIKANLELVADTRLVVQAIEDQLYSRQYLNKIDTLKALEALVKAAYGGLRMDKLYKEVITGLEATATHEGAVIVLTELWKLFDAKIQNNIGHKTIAEETLSGLEQLLATNFFKSLPSCSSDVVKPTLAALRILEVGLAKLERHKKETKVNPHTGFNTYLNNTIKKGPLAAKYSELK